MRSRQLEILLYLMETKKSTYAELANRFEVSRKTIMRDIDKLSGMGVPVYTQPGYEGGVFLAPDYRFNRSFFTAEEIEDIILAFHIVHHLDAGVGKNSALKKLELLIPELTFLKEFDFTEYLKLELLQKPVTAHTPVCKVINAGLDDETCMLLAVGWILKKGFFPSFRHLHGTTLCRRAWELFRLGFVQTVIQALAGCTGFFVNHSLMLHATLNHVAIWNIVQKIYTLLLMPVVGITQGIQTVIAYYSGHKQETEKQKTIRLTVFYTVLYGCIGTGFVFLFGNRILSIFGSSDAILAQSTAVLKIIFLTFPVVGIFYTILTLLEVTEHEIKAVILTLLRQVFLLLPLVYLLPNLFPQLKHAVFWAVPVSDLLILFLAIIMKAIAFENSKDNRAGQR